jgi:hypothetical protein
MEEEIEIRMARIAIDLVRNTTLSGRIIAVVENATSILIKSANADVFWGVALAGHLGCQCSRLISTASRGCCWHCLKHKEDQHDF